MLQACLQYLQLKRVFHWRNNSGALKTENHFVRFGATGSPDIIAIIKGQCIGIECKATNGKQSDHQKVFQFKMEQAGGKYYLVHSLDDLVAVVK